MVPTLEELKTALERGVPGVSLGVEGSSLVVEAKDLVRVCKFLKDSPEFQLDYVSNLTAVDFPPDLPAPTAVGAQAGRIQMAYHLYSMAEKHGRVALKVNLPRDHPVVASLTPLYRGAEFQEREVYDLFGVTFEGHSDLRRILMWEGFTGHPLRKDYVVEDQDVLEEPA